MSIRVAALGRNRSALTLLGLDLVGLVVTIYLVLWVRFGVFISPSLWGLIAVVLVVIISLYLVEAYSVGPEHPRFRMIFRLVAGITIAGVVTSGLIYLLGTGRLRTEPVLWRSVLPFILIAFSVWAAVSRLAVVSWLQRFEDRRRWLIVASADDLECLLDDFSRSTLAGHLALVTTAPPATLQPMDRTTVSTHQWDQLDQLLAQPWTAIVAGLSARELDIAGEQLLQAKLMGSPVITYVEFYERYWLRIPVEAIDTGWSLAAPGFQLIHNRFLINTKRMVDVLASVLILAVSTPLILVIAILVMLDSPGGVLFTQSRTGKGGIPFTILKFRSMYSNAEIDGAKWAAVDDPRVTRMGRCLRRWRLDELPQLFNVIRGDMSLIGPRPERPEFTGFLNNQIPNYDIRHVIKPGISGWAQVMYPYGSSVKDALRKLTYDVYYIKNYSFLLDLAILVKTVKVVLLGAGR